MNNNSYPRVLTIGIERINALDTNNNGMLLRKLFANFPSEKLAQIYSYGDNGDNGFFSNYFRISTKERFFGKLFFYLKKHELPKNNIDIRIKSDNSNNNLYISRVKEILKYILVDSGVFELIFRPKLSKNLKIWVEKFNPDIIFVQGYSLYYIWLCIKLKEKYNIKVAFLTTDDWPSNLYKQINGKPNLYSWLIRPIVNKSTKKLLKFVDIPFAFHSTMTKEYEKRYLKKFITLCHSDNPERFEQANSKRYHPENIISILTTGFFNKKRWELLIDANKCCELLSIDGITARILVISSGIDENGLNVIKSLKNIDIINDPGNDILPQYLKGADINLLVEDFDEKRSRDIKLSISSKSHLFMISKRPIIVYAHPQTGVSQYAQEEKWASVVMNREVNELKNKILQIVINKDFSDTLILNAMKTFNKYHVDTQNQKLFLDSLNTKI